MYVRDSSRWKNTALHDFRTRVAENDISDLPGGRVAPAQVVSDSSRWGRRCSTGSH